MYVWYTCMMQPEKIDIGFPTAGSPEPEFVANMMKQVADMEYFGCYGGTHMVQSSILQTSRNILVRKFLEESDSPWLWMVDDDMTFDEGHVMRLWETASEYDMKMVSALAFMFKDGQHPIPSYFGVGDGRFYPKGQYYISFNKIPTQVTEVAATGLASVLVHRDVFEAMEAPRYDPYRWFDLINLPNNEGLCGEDVVFFHRAREKGFKLLLNPEVETRHIKSISIGRNDFDRYWELRNANSADNRDV